MIVILQLMKKGPLIEGWKANFYWAEWQQEQAAWRWGASVLTLTAKHGAGEGRKHRVPAPFCSCSILHVVFGLFAGWFLLIPLLLLLLPPSPFLPSSHPYCSLSKPYSLALSWLCSTGVSASCGRKVDADMTSDCRSLSVSSFCLHLSILHGKKDRGSEGASCHMTFTWSRRDSWNISQSRKIIVKSDSPDVYNSKKNLD